MAEIQPINKLRHFLDRQDRLTVYPVKFKNKKLALFYLASKFEPDKRYTEKEINEIIKAWHTFDDWCLLRRDLFENGFLGREPNGSYYWLEDPQPTLADFGL